MAPKKITTKELLVREFVYNRVEKSSVVVRLLQTQVYRLMHGALLTVSEIFMNIECRMPKLRHIQPAECEVDQPNYSKD